MLITDKTITDFMRLPRALTVDSMITYFKYKVSAITLV